MTESRWKVTHLPNGTTVGWSLLLGLFLLAVGLVQSTDPPAAVSGWRIAQGLVLVGILSVAVDTLTDEHPRRWRSAIPSLLAGAVLFVLLFQYQSETLPLGPPTWLELTVLFVVLGVFLIGDIHRTPVTPQRVLLIGMFAVVAGLFLYHTTTTPAGIAPPAWPIWAVVVSAVSLLLIPRHVPVQSFLYSVSLLAGVASAIAIYAYIGGATTVLGFEVAVVNQDVPFTDYDLDGWYGITSVFNNINVFGLVAFAGLSTAVFTLHRSWESPHRLSTTAAGVLVVLNGVGLVLSSSDAAWIAAVVTLGFFATYLCFGRRSVLPTLVVGLTVGLAAVTAVYLNIVPVDDGGRFDRWRSAVRAMQDHPSMLGHGYISTAEFTAPYTEEMGEGTPHNSYLSILIRMGTIGATAYVVLVWGTIAYRAIHPDTTDVAMLAFAIGWGTHHLFESYTMVQWTPPAVLSAMTLGYLLFATTNRDSTKETLERGVD